MKRMKYILVFCMLLTGFVSYAQVGILNNDAKASLHVSPSASGQADGIIAPNLTRAELISKDSRYTAAQSGALVYVTDIDGTATPKTVKVIRSGYYYFDGSLLLWQAVDQLGQYFYLPTFMLPTTVVGTGKTFDLYNEVYQKQFVRAGNTSYMTNNSGLYMIPAARHMPTELDYVVTYYDTDVIKINSISTSGIINYDVISTVLGPGSFINVVLVTKR